MNWVTYWFGKVRMRLERGRRLQGLVDQQIDELAAALTKIDELEAELQKLKGRGPTTSGFSPAPYTPFLIEMMLVCYWSPYPADQFGARWDSAVGKLARNTLREQGLVNDDYRPTSKGEQWVKRICRVPIDAPAIGSVNDYYRAHGVKV